MLGGYGSGIQGQPDHWSRSKLINIQSTTFTAQNSDVQQNIIQRDTNKQKNNYYSYDSSYSNGVPILSLFLKYKHRH